MDHEVLSPSQGGGVNSQFGAAWARAPLMRLRHKSPDPNRLGGEHPKTRFFD